MAARAKPATGKRKGRAGASANARKLRVRMFRVGFGDFFLVSVPTKEDYRHILIDCGVHAKDVHSIGDAVAEMASVTGNELALVIMTHRHADHISGFAKCKDAFRAFSVERVWMPWFEDRADGNAMAFQASLAAVASRLAQALAARQDDRSAQLREMMDNITGGLGVSGLAANQVALDVLHGGFRNKAPVDYYRAGDAATLPPSLADAGLTAEILGPPGDLGLIGQMTNKNQQYLAGMTDDTAAAARLVPFPEAFRTDSSACPAEAFQFFSARKIEKLIAEAQPDVLAAKAEQADKTLNNQSLVVLFNFGGKRLLFAGDAQWGNWENFLFGGAFGTPGHTQLTDKARAILSGIDFYKVGHHGSANATPIAAVDAMRSGCAGMCSTHEKAYNGVPRGPLLEALAQKMNDQLARSDQVPAGDAAAASDAGAVPKAFSTPGKLYIDYLL